MPPPVLPSPIHQRLLRLLPLLVLLLLPSFSQAFHHLHPRPSLLPTLSRSSVSVSVPPPPSLLIKHPSPRCSTPRRTTIHHAWPKNRDPKGMPADYPLALARISITVAATVLTYYAHAHARVCSPVMASAAVTLTSSLIAPGLGQAAMCGTFAGMSGLLVLPSVPWALGAGVVTSVLFETLIHYYDWALGLGGRLGMIAFIAVNFIVAAGCGGGNCGAACAAKKMQLNLDSLKNLPSILYNVDFAAILSTLRSPPFSILMTFTALGALATIALREAGDDTAVTDPVRAAAVVGMLGSLVVGFGGGLYCDLGALATYGGAFVGMSLPSRLMRGIVPGGRKKDFTVVGSASSRSSKSSNGKILASFTVAGLVSGLIHGWTLQKQIWMGGWGGKVGFCSFMGVLVYRGVAKAIETVQGWRRRRKAQGAI